MEIVTPGTVVGTLPMRSGFGTKMIGDQIIATVSGRIRESSNLVVVESLNKSYFPGLGDLVIADVISVRNNMWILDVRGPFEAILPASLVPWASGYGQTHHQMTPGASVLARIQDVDETMRCVLTMKGAGLRKLVQGSIVDVPIGKINRLTGGDVARLSALKEAADCRAIVGGNGRIWIDGSLDHIQWLRDAIVAISKANDVGGVFSQLLESAPSSKL